MAIIRRTINRVSYTPTDDEAVRLGAASPVRIQEALEGAVTNVLEVDVATEFPALTTGDAIVINHVDVAYGEGALYRSRRTFTGNVTRIRGVTDPHGVTLMATGDLALLRRTFDTDRDLTGMTDQAAARNILTRCGITYTTADVVGLSYVLGQRRPIIWPKGTPAAEIMDQLNTTFGFALMEIGNGRVVRFPYHRSPYKYTDPAFAKVLVYGRSTVSFFGHERTRGEIEQIQNYWRVEGLSWSGETITSGWRLVGEREWENAAGTVVESTTEYEDGTWGNPTTMGYAHGGITDHPTINGLTESDGCSYVVWAEAKDTHPKLGAGIYAGPETFQSDLIQTEGMAKAVAVRLMQWYNREPDTIRVECPNDARTTPGDLITVRNPRYGLDTPSTRRYLVLNVTREGDLMQLDCIGGAAGEVGALSGGYDICCGTQQEDGTCVVEVEDEPPFEEPPYTTPPDPPIEEIPGTDPEDLVPPVFPPYEPPNPFVPDPVEDINTDDPFIDCEEMLEEPTGEPAPPPEPGLGFGPPGHYVMWDDMEGSNFRAAGYVAYHVLEDGSSDHVALGLGGMLFANETQPLSAKEADNDLNVQSGPGAVSVSGEVYLRQYGWMSIEIRGYSEFTTLHASRAEFYADPGHAHTFTGAIGVEDDLLFFHGIRLQTEHSTPNYSPHGPPHNCDRLFVNCNNGGYDAEGGLPLDEWLPFAITFDFSGEFQRVTYSIGGFGGYMEDLREINLSPGDLCCGGGPQEYDICTADRHTLAFYNESLSSAGHSPEVPSLWNVRLRNIVVGHSTCEANPDYVPFDEIF